MKVGVYGGTFDPVHIGHLAVAADVAHAFGLDEVLFVPANRAPLRNAAEADGRRRYEMCRIATADNPRFRVSSAELDRPAPSFTVDTLAALRGQFPDTEFDLIAGADILRELKEWRGVGDLLATTRIIVVARPGFSEETLDAVAEELRARDRLLLHRSTRLHVASSDIRQRIAEGRPYRYYLHPAVAKYIERHGLYGARGRTG